MCLINELAEIDKRGRLDWADYGFFCTTNKYTEIKESLFLNTIEALSKDIVVT